MRHHNTNRKFGRIANQRHALMRSLARSLLLKGTILTTQARAKELRPMVEKLITRGKNPTLGNRRLLISRVGGSATIVKKIETIAEKYKTRTGGYTRVVKMPARKSDASPMAIIQFVE